MAIVGDILTTPESGWLQLDESRIKYVGSTWYDIYGASYTDGSMKVTYGIGDYFEFTFFGRSFRLIGYIGDNRAKNITLIVDGVSEKISQYSSTNKSNVLMYEKKNLDLAFHTVKVQLNENLYMNIDRVDINEPTKKSIVKNPLTNQYYSLAEKTLITLPDASSKNMILHGIEAGKEIQLDVKFDKINYISSVDKKIATQALDKNINKILRFKEV